MRAPLPSWSEAAVFFRLVRGIRPFVAEKITFEQAREAIRRRLKVREERFLEKLETAVFSCPSSPYFRLFEAAGCEPGDVRRLVRREGVESTLDRLRRAGVFVTWEEFKGWKPIYRGSQTFQVRAKDFDNPVVREHFTATSGGTSGRPVRVRIDIEELAEAAVNWAVCFDAHGWKDRPLVFWTPGNSGFASRYLRCMKFGFPYAKWFRINQPDNPADSFRALLLHRTLRFLAGLPAPQPAPLDRAPVVLESLLQLLEDGHKPIVNTTPSAACRLARLAGERGRSLSGVDFLLGAEPVTRVRRSIIESSEAGAVPTYGTSEAGWIGAQFPEARAADEVSVFRDAYAVIQRPEGGSSALVGHPILFTGLRRASPKVLVNTEIGDSAVIGFGRAPVSAPGYDVNLHTIRSFRKVTLWGTSFAVADLYHLVEETLPDRFGGGPHCYQLVEEEEPGGLTHLRLLISPEVRNVEETAVRQAFLAELRKRRHYYDLMVDVLSQADALRIERRNPIRTARGKLLPVLPLHHDRSGPGTSP